MSKLIWIDNDLLFKIKKVYSSQYLCVCANWYKNKLEMEIGDIIFIKIIHKPKSYQRLGTIKAFADNKVIIGVMTDIGSGSKSKMEILHNQTLTQEGAIEEET